jgi:hypothetical protein
MDDNDTHKTLLQIVQQQREQEKKLDTLLGRVPNDKSSRWVLAAIVTFVLGIVFTKCNRDTNSPFQVAQTYQTEAK